jgi:hypothetical protein
MQRPELGPGRAPPAATSLKLTPMGSRRMIPPLLARRTFRSLSDGAKLGGGGGLTDDEFGREHFSLCAAAAAKPLQH